MVTFRCISVAPSDLAHPNLAIATVLAGGVGVLDLEYITDSSRALSNLLLLQQQTRQSPDIGLRLQADCLAKSQPLLGCLSSHSFWIILTGWTIQALPELLAQLPTDPSPHILLELTRAEDMSEMALDGQLPAISSVCLDRLEGFIVRGYESGGWVGEDSAFILTQKLLELTDLPIYVQGGIGIHTAAACRAAGAAGVVLDDQLWLMPESPLSEAWQQHLRGLSGQEAKAMGDRLLAPLRVLTRPGFSAALQLQRLADQLEADSASSLEWHQAAAPLVGWGDPKDFAWPVGQAIGQAAAYQRRYRTTGRFIQALLRAVEVQVQCCQREPLLRPDSPLAISHGTRYPIMQGPMTRVSDTPDFAQAVAAAGGLPMLALALMPKQQVTELLNTAQAQLGQRPWGVGLLGFAPNSLRQAQMEVVKAVRPPFAIIAGGRPDQAAQLEAEGIATYIHVPTPNLLQMFLEQGARRFIFEGFECGGHVGPLSSFVLWESMIQVLLIQGAKQAAEIHVIFAGGVHSACSAAMVSAMAAPLAAHGIRVGVLMGSAYLFTHEAVACGAIVEEFQQQVLVCDRTINLETGPGHASRCAMTPFAQEFYRQRQEMLRANRDAEEIKVVLEDLTLGRLRIASKGIRRNTDGLQSLDAQTQRAEGMYMVGQVATLRHQLTSIAALHEEVSLGSEQWLSELDLAPDVAPEPGVANIAVVGIGTLLPKAQEPEVFWQNILDRVNAISEIPAHRWDWQLYYDADRQARDKVYSKWGGFLDAIPFDPMRFGIPPKSLKSIEPAQLLTLEAVRLALADAGYDEDSIFDRDRTSVILGASGGLSELGQQYATRAELPRMVENLELQDWERLPEWTEESFPGILLNVTAGRVANRFNLGGSNFTVDAACASSLAAVDVAVQELTSGRTAMAVVGGVDTLQSAFAYFCFSKTRALSPQGIARSFDQDADGIVISEGIAVVVLKRLADAERDGDRIYGVIKAVASSSDGKGLSMTAPASSGQQRALHRAYEKAGISPATLGLYEAHGTGTAVGDRTELQTITSLLQSAQAPPNSCAVGSVKTLIGHTKSTAGVAALIKAVLALYHRVLPPHTQVERPLERLQGDTPTYLLKEGKPWLASPSHPRRAGISAFGFGGTNFHAVLEEYTGNRNQAPLGADHWPAELLLIPAIDRGQLLSAVDRLLADLAAGAQPALANLAYSYVLALGRQSLPVGLAIVASDLPQLQEALAMTKEWLKQEGAEPLPSHIQVHPAMATGSSAEEPGKVAFLFPGQGSQYPNMARELALFLPEMREALEIATAQLQDRLPLPLEQAIYPPATYTEADQQATQAALTHTQMAQPAIGAISLGYLGLMHRLGIEANMVAGHSYGEYVALHAGGVLDREAFLHLSETRGRVMAEALSGEEGSMAAVMASREVILEHLVNTPEVLLANHNAPQQSVISGPKAALAEVMTKLQAAGLSVQSLPVAGAFHSPAVESARADLATAIAAVPMHSPRVPIYSNVTASPYRADSAAIQAQLSQHIVSPVEFVQQIEAMYADGARTFIEVGPKGVLTKLMGQILEDRSHLAVSLDSRLGLAGLLQSLAILALRGVTIDWLQLYRNRPVCEVDLHRLVTTTQPAPLPAGVWWIDGGSARPGDLQDGYFGQRPPFTQQTKVLAVPSTLAHASDHEAGSAIAATPTSVDRPFTLFPSEPSTFDLQPPAMRIPMIENAAQPNLLSIARHHDETVLQAYQSYQTTMQQFLVLQEKVMGQFLNCLGTGGSLIELPAAQQVSDGRVLSSQPKGHTSAEINGLHGVLQTNTATHDRMMPASVVTSPPPADPSPPPAPLATVVSIPSPVASVEPVATPLATTVDDGFDREALVNLLLTLVSDRTGYPPDMLGLDQDMEADLGIDSIKRIEILGALQKQLPAALAATVQTATDRFTQVKTLNGLVDALFETLASTSTQAMTPPEVQRLGKSEDAAAQLSRYVMQACSEPLPSPSNELTGLILMTADGAEGIALSLAPQIQAAGASPAVLSVAALADPELLARTIADHRQRWGPVQGIVHLAGAAPLAMPQTLAEWRQQTRQQSKSLFHLLQLCSNDLRQNRGLLLSASLLGGAFGRDGRCGPGLPAAGSSSGLLKTAMIEWPEVRMAVVDLDAGQSAATQAACLLEELRSQLLDAEVGYPGGQRTVFRPLLKPLAAVTVGDHPVEPGKDWVVLAVGGARGITAEVLKGLVVPGMTVVLVGRSSLATVESAQTLGIADPQQLRQVLVQLAKGKGQTTTPAELEKQLRQLQRDRVIRDNLEAFRRMGAIVDYRTIDLQNENSEASIQALMADIYQRYGRLDSVLQGAGIIEDKLIVDKQVDSFERVFDTKVDSTFLLSRYLRPETLKLVLLFASVAGRSGNRGQADYAAANEVVNRFAWWMQQQWSQVRVLSVNWGPWAMTGMASDEVNRQFQARGIIPIPPALGCQYVLDELRSGSRAEAEVVAGIFQGPPQTVMASESLTASSPPAAPAGCPLLTRLPQLQPNGSVVLDQTFSLESDPYLDDHRLDGQPVLAAAAAQEWLAECVQAAWPDWVVAEVRNLKVLKGIVLKTAAGQAVHIVARASTHASPDSLEVTAEIIDAVEKRCFYRAVLVLKPQLEPPPLADWAPLLEGFSLDVPLAYAQYCFHGQQFQLITQLSKISTLGLDANVRASRPASWLNRPAEPRSWLFDPGLIDASLQMALMFTRIHGDISGLPGRFGRVVRYGSIAPGETLSVYLRVKTFDMTVMIYDALFVDSHQRVCLRLDDMESICSKALNRLTSKP